MRFGVHLSIAKGLRETVEEAKRLQCDTIQIFTRSPRMWKTRTISPDEAHAFSRALKKAHIFPLVVHTPYLPNLCTSDKALYQRSVAAFKEDVARAEILGAQYLVIHPGAYSPEKTREDGYRNLLSAFDRLFTGEGSLMILIENMAGGGRRIGNSFEGLAGVMNRSRLSGRLGICLDTCHAVGAGFDLSCKEGTDDLVHTINRTVGMGRVKLLHINDSKSPVGSHLDRHEHIGKGYIGRKGFRYFLNHPAFQGLPAILETPKSTPHADVENLALVRKLTHRTTR